MWTGAYENLIGWRYLLRRKASPRLLFVGLSLVVTGGAVLGLGAWLQSQSGEAISVFGMGASASREIMGGGAIILVIGLCASLLGFLNTFMTIFSAFSTFMITIGVAEVILVLGVMNGFQGDLRQKIINTYAHVTIEKEASNEWLETYDDLIDRARKVPGVIGASPVLRTEVMLNAPTNLAAVALVGVDTKTISETSQIPLQLKKGCLDVLDDSDAQCEQLEDGPALLKGSDRDQVTNMPTNLGTKTRPPDASSVAEAADTDDEMAFPLPAKVKSGPPPALLIGAELRRNLSLWPQEVISVVSPMGDLGPNGPIPKSRPFHLGGWFESGMLEFDTKLAYAGIHEVQAFMGVGDVASAVQIRVDNLEGARQVRNALREQLPKGLRITDWQERNHGLFSALQLEKVAMFLVLTINILLAAFSITSTLVMTIMERRREVAILMAMGSSQRSILKIFVSQGAFTGICGSILGATIGLTAGFMLAKLGLPLNEEVYYISAIPVDVRALDVLAIILVAMLVSLGSTIYPALFASRLRPVEGLKAE